ncbi:MAG TPA: hypothetical protein VKG44_09945, partial [Candidatus Baltobacteraceae bacterium]|nr:hypothetical protein [Candidatus Baltobacteraceae bacterium]
SRTLGFTPSRTVLESIADMLGRLPLDDVEELSHPRHYNIRWMTLLEKIHSEQADFDAIY